MSRIDDIWEAYYKGQAAAEEDDPLDMAMHHGFGHAAKAMMSVFGESDEEIAFEKGYHGEDLEICDECEHVLENCECEGSVSTPSSTASSSASYSSSGESYSSGSSYSSYSSYDSGSLSSSYNSGSSSPSSTRNTNSNIGVIVRGLLFVAVGVFFVIVIIPALIKKDTSVTPAQSMIQTQPSTSVATSNRKPSKKTTPTPIPQEPSSVQWIKSDSFWRIYKWKVILTSNKWFDTGIPYSANDTLNVSQYSSQNTDPNTLIKLGGREYANSDGRQIYLFEERGTKPDFRDTVKLKLREGATRVELEVAITNQAGYCIDPDGHQAIHDASYAWLKKTVEKMKR